MMSKCSAVLPAQSNRRQQTQCNLRLPRQYKCGLQMGVGGFGMVYEHTNQAHTHSNTLGLLSGGELLVKYNQLRKSPYYHMSPLFPIPITLPYSNSF